MERLFENRLSFVRQMMKAFVQEDGGGHTKTSVEKLAAQQYGITDKTEVKELTELAIVRVARFYAQATDQTVRERYGKIVALYNRQVNLSHRTSQSILLQQYSTPAPIGFLMGIFCELDTFSSRGRLAFEPSAGNGLLTIAGDPSYIYVNEVDPLRRENLSSQGYANVWDKDATIPFTGLDYMFDAVLTNPPFGILDRPVYYNDYKITTLDHLMALRALDTMKDNGKASIIIGGHTTWDKLGRIQAGKNRIFFNYLYNHYYVKDAINLDGKKLYSRQGTAFDVRLILIAGRKPKPIGAAPLKQAGDEEVHSFDDLFERVMAAMGRSYNDQPEILKTESMKHLEAKAQHILQMLRSNTTIPGTLEAPYQPASEACVVLNTQVPDSMAYETQSAVERVRIAVGGDMDNFVRHRLGYTTKIELCRALSAEQIDAVGMAIYNIEARNQGMIIGDQTGIGKGRVAASVIRYACQQGLKPIFLTEKANLFSDIYRDLAAIGSGHLRPFIVNARESKTDIKDEDGNVVYQAPEPNVQKDIIASRQLPPTYDFVVATYSQFNQEDKKPQKPAFLRAVAEDNVFIMDEAHNSSGASNTGIFMQGVVARTRGVVFLSATFAKRPDNMPIYAMKTAISDCTMSKENLVEAITKGGVALQEVLSAQLVSEGQMLRRERSYEGVEVNYITLTDKTEEHSAIADNVTEIIRDIIAFQKAYVDSIIKELDEIVAAEGKSTELREGTNQAGVDNLPYFSKVFQVIGQMLFSIKAEAVADRAIMRLREGKKPVIAFASTMGSFIETLQNDVGLPVSDGDIINADFSEVLWRGLDGVMRYTEKDPAGNSIHKRFTLSELGPAAIMEYERIAARIRTVSTGITISPIDVIVQKLKAAGYSVAEVTGRKYELQLNHSTGMGLVRSRRRVNTNDAFRQFNNNEVDVLLINQSGSTGASAHAIPTSKVPADQVKQRVMIVLQAELDISTEVQKRGRINRTGQIIKPIYDYITSAIPAEQRLMMMLQKKLKSLDANTSSNQKQSNKILDVPDFLNKYGDKIVKEYLIENEEVNNLLDDPLYIKRSLEDSVDSEPSYSEDAAMKVSGRVAVLSVKMQTDFYSEVSSRYNDYVEYLKQVGEYDLEVEAMELQAETTNARVIKMGNGAGSVFGTDSILETVKANVLRKPFSRAELDTLLAEAIKTGTPQQLQQQYIDNYTQYWQTALDKELQETEQYYQQLINDIPNEKKIQKLNTGTTEWTKAVAEREKELQESKQKKIELLNKTAKSKKDYLVKLFRFFTIGRNLSYTVFNFEKGKEMIPAVFLGFVIDHRKKNPYLPSQVKLRFAVASSMKYIALPASMSADVLAIIGASVDTEQPKDQDTLLNNWQEYIRQSSVDRNTRHIITGNLLQAFAGYKGKLVSYTTLDGQTKKGILMPEYWDTGKPDEERVTVPIIKALPLIRSLTTNGQLNTDNGLSFFKKNDAYRVIVSSSRQRAGELFLDKDLLALVRGGNFEKVSNNMSAWVEESNLQPFVQILNDKHKHAVTLTPYQFQHIDKSANTVTALRSIELPPPVDEAAEQIAAQQQAITATQNHQQPDIKLLELEAKALIIKLKLQMRLAA
ncbi:MAG TPA: strawberry notch C-terminal domain-containing protein [Chitinophaga sp.]|uniref:strawberry notch C-terminal domain-containing protein n=1 Tax=Chitinophaga sp. TaxID=1869181 RepID=UPI002C8D2F5E|nr:strawberry notch C-terminal domain-containing protein [Chitinophaga sp.]HVI45223.1 strawberry notch C-terminal domain-containing protein [Chitinophaga sp.]